MGIEKLLTFKIIGEILDWIDELEFALLKGLAYILLIIAFLWFLIYFLVWQGYYGHLSRTLWIIGIWVFVEFAYFIGGGHNARGNFQL